MRISTIVVVILRLFSLYWLASFVIALLGAVALVNVSAMTRTTGGMKWMFLLPLLVPFAYLLLSVLTWIFASRISTKVVGGINEELGASTIGPSELYSVGILVTGLYFFLSYLGGSISWLHYLVVNKAGDALVSGSEEVSLYDVSSQILPCAAGVYFAVYSRRFGRRLALQGKPAEQVVPPKSDRAGG